MSSAAVPEKRKQLPEEFDGNQQQPQHTSPSPHKQRTMHSKHRDPAGSGHKKQRRGAETAASYEEPGALDCPTLASLKSKQDMLTQFGFYRNLLDQHHDRREKIIKTSRDITSLSKKMIFALHRITQSSQEAVFKETEEKRLQVLKLFESITSDIGDSNLYRYQFAISPGLQEFIEAVGFWVFLKDGGALASKEVIEEYLTLPSPSDANTGDAVPEEVTGGNEVVIPDTISDCKPVIAVPDEEYLMGLADLPGEVTRYCINAIGKGDYQAPKGCCEFLRNLKQVYCVLETSPYLSRKLKEKLKEKLKVLDSSLDKVEHAYYDIALRGSEYPQDLILAGGGESNPGAERVPALLGDD